jgi:ArsR family transcriptional regulator
MHLTADSFFTALAHPLRLRALLLIRQEGEVCVCELTHCFGVAQPLVSRHLAQLREAGLVLDRREGVWIHYRLHPDLPAWAAQVLAATAEGLAGSSPHRDDRAVLAAMPNRPTRCCA